MNEDLPPDLRALFDAERRRDEAPPPGARERVSQALAVSLGIGIGAAATAAGSAQASIGAAAAGKGVLGAGATAAAAAAAASSVGVTATGGALAKGLALALATAIVGTTGAGIYLAKRDDSAPAIVEVRTSNEVPATFDPSVLAKKPPRPVVPRPPQKAPVAVEATPIVPPSPKLVEASTPEQRAERLRGERAVLDTARAAVARGDGGAALIALEAHRESYRDGALIEERDALTVLALAKLGRTRDAQQKAQAFRDKNPRSLFLPAIEGALR